MIKAKEKVKNLEVGTKRCDDSISWSPIRVSYSREFKVKAMLNRIMIGSFVPMIYKTRSN